MRAVRAGIGRAGIGRARVGAGLAGLVAVGVLAAPMAHAAKAKPACDLVTDPAGDVIGTAPGVDNGDYDIRSADVATDKRNLTAVIRLTSLAPNTAVSTAGRTYEFDFTANGHTFGLQAALLTGGASYQAVVYDTSTPGGRTGTDLGDIVGVVDTAHHEIRMTAPLWIFATYASFKQTYIADLDVTSGRAGGYGAVDPPGGKVHIGSEAATVVVDDASSTARYLPGARSCVAVGK
ncbi:MAG: hypothetical protein JO079_01750 [Frankiaceae bacterium]|nr:hypothetical protein [Frankiaceae bacterium]MBV9368446.1 hypothetical protein [Frankiales bacterium]